MSNIIAVLTFMTSLRTLLMKYTLSILVENESGVLSRLTGLFTRKGFNIESLAVGSTENEGISRITMVVPASDRTINQLIKQLCKLINVLKVQNITDRPLVERELLLIKLQAPNEHRSEILELVRVFRANVVDISHTSLILEVTGDPGKLFTVEKLLSRYGILEIVRTGRIALARHSNMNTEFLRQTNLGPTISPH